MRRIVFVLVAAFCLLSLALATAGDPKVVPLPDMSGPSTCVSLYELQPDGSLVFIGASKSPSFQGERSDLLLMMPIHLHHAFQFIGRHAGKSEAWLAERDAAPITLTDGISVSPEYVRVQGGDGGATCWCATPTVDGLTKKIIGCDFPCGGCEKCVVTPRG